MNKRLLLSARITLLPTIFVLAMTACTETKLEAPASAASTYIPMADINNLKQAKAALIPYPQKADWGDGVYRGEQINRVIKPLTFSDSEEAYKLSVTKTGIEIQANHQRGLYYAGVTLAQLSAKQAGVYPLVEIEDAPAYEIRGVMHDVGRNFQPIADLKQQLVHLARYKLNTFHWHLSDHPGWRIESIKYPQLNKKENYRASRDPGQFYTYQEINELIQFANQLNINVIPELDMPGHSMYFTHTFGFKMGSEQGRKICLDLLQEFFDHVPIAAAPIIHIGADEVKIDDPEQFIQLMVDKIEGAGRTAVVWDPGLKPLSGTIAHTWKGKNKYPERRAIDSVDLYTNKMDPFNMLNQIYFKRINGELSENKAVSLGGIVATWNDVNVDEPIELLRNNPFYSSAITAAEVFWKGNKTGNSTYQFQFPAKDTLEHDMLAEFEQRLLYHKTRFFNDNDDIFFYRPQFEANWRVSLKLPEKAEQSKIDVNKFVAIEQQALGGNTLVYKTRQSRGNIAAGYFQGVPVDTQISATRTFYSDSNKKVKLYLGLSMPERSHRMWQGVPESGQWDAFGASVTLNGQAVEPPKWQQPGFQKVLRSVWRSPIKEIPWTDEDLYWLRQPVVVELKVGDNQLVINSKLGYKHQVWQVTSWLEPI